MEPARVTTFQPLSEAEMAAIAPLRDGEPDLYNHLPTRFVSKQESIERGWKMFYIGDVCHRGHKAPRYVKNPRDCIDCHRLRRGRDTIGGKGIAEAKTQIRPYKEREKVAGAPAALPRPIEPDQIEKQFLVEYARLRDFNAAAAQVQRDPAVFRARASYSKVFLEALNTLEDREGLLHTLCLDETFDWDDDKRKMLIRVFVDTGDLGIARDSIGVSNFLFQKELSENADFASKLEEAAPLAATIMEEHAVRRSKGGDSKLLTLYLQANVAKYSPKLKVDMSVTEKLSDEQLDSRLVRFQQQLIELKGLPVLDTTAVDVDEEAEAGIDGDDGGEAASVAAEQNLDLL